MASLDSHINKAVHNISVAAYLSKEETFKDWIVTVAFYSALHIVDSVLYQTQKGFSRHGQSHDNRDKIVKYDNRLSKIWEHYSGLKRESIIARYLQAHLTPPDKSIDFDKRMPESHLKAFLREKLGGLINASEKWLPKEKHRIIKEAFNNNFKEFLSLK